MNPFLEQVICIQVLGANYDNIVLICPGVNFEERPISILQGTCIKAGVPVRFKLGGAAAGGESPESASVHGFVAQGRHVIPSASFVREPSGDQRRTS